MHGALLGLAREDAALVLAAAAERKLLPKHLDGAVEDAALVEEVFHDVVDLLDRLRVADRVDVERHLRSTRGADAGAPDGRYR